MKIHKIILKDYQQFKDLEIDLTYPSGHEKAGQPLDKVCFIGQSGTGKTTLLRLIKYFVTWNPYVTPSVKVNLKENAFVRFEASIQSASGHRILNKNGVTTSEGFTEIEEEYHRRCRPVMIDLPTENKPLLKSEEDFILNEGNYVADDELRGRKIMLRHHLGYLNLGIYVDMAFQDIERIYLGVLSSLGNHQSSEILLREKIAFAVLDATGNGNEVDKAKEEYQKWVSENPNPIEFIAKCTEPILETLGVRVKVDLDEDTLRHLGAIRIQTLGGDDVSPENWSTGIKQIIQSSVPISHLHPNGAILLIDEPEKSLYPDIQSKIIDFYTSLTTDCQFFYATHSPIIASSFDPWEIVELKFDENNQYVIQETNIAKGKERHVDNYTVFPKYLKWDGILTKLFDLMEDGNSEFRTEAITKAASLELELEDMKEKGNNKGPKFERLLADYIKLKTKLGWE